MNRDDIIRMAQEVSGVEFPAPMDGVKIGMGIEHLERFANLVAAAEREACAALCDKEAQREELADDGTLGARYGAYCCAITIRERGAP
jgi:hypothetical protein